MHFDSIGSRLVTAYRERHRRACKRKKDREKEEERVEGGEVKQTQKLYLK